MAHEETLTRYNEIADGFTQVLAAVPADKWNATSPCEGWSLRDVVGHIVNGHRGFVAGDAAAQFGPDENPVTAWADALAGVQQKAAEPGALDALMPGPFGPMPAHQMIESFISTDVMVHTWDVAKGAGVSVTLHPASVALCQERLYPMDEMIRRPGVFGPKTQAPEGADAQTELMAFLGRDVS